MQGVPDEYAMRLVFLEASEPGSLNLARLYLEMATMLDRSQRFQALSLFDKADQIFAAHLSGARDAAVAGLALSLNNRAALEIEAGEWAWAVDAASQAVALRRERLAGCVGRKDDTERLDLGFSLAALILALRGEGQIAQACDVSLEALSVLKPFAGMKNQAAFVLLAKVICVYAELCHVLGQEPDVAVLLPLAKAFYEGRQGPG